MARWLASRGKSEPAAAVEPEGSRWDAVIEAYRRYQQNKRDQDRVQALRDAIANTCFDTEITEAFREVSRVGRPTFEAALELASLSTDERLDLLAMAFELCAPIRMVTYPGRTPVEEDSEVAQLGISIEPLRRLRANHPPLGQVFPYQESLLRDRRLELNSPLSGRPLVSTANLFQLAGTGRPQIIFHFLEEGEPLYLFTSTFNGCWSGWFLPERDLMVTFPAPPQNAIGMFRALVTECALETAGHLAHQEERELALLVGTMNHFGHSILNEYEAYHRCCEAGLFDGVDVVLRGWANFMPHTDVFPELGGKPVIEIADMMASYRMVVEGRYLVTRPTCNYWFSVGLGQRLMGAARRHRAAHPPPRLAEAERRWPLLWIEIRSHDRRWVDQEQQLPQLIDNLATHYPNLGVIAAGWSRMEEVHPQDERMIESDAAVVTSVREKITAAIPVFDITGVGMLDKFAWAVACDAFVSTYGTGLIFPCYTCEKPGVLHTNSGYMSKVTEGRIKTLVLYTEASADIHMIDPSDIRDEDPDQPLGIRSHYLDWRPVYEELMSILGDLAPPAAAS